MKDLRMAVEGEYPASTNGGIDGSTFTNDDSRIIELIGTVNFKDDGVNTSTISTFIPLRKASCVSMLLPTLFKFIR